MKGYAVPIESGTPRLVTDLLRLQELVKTAANSFLATKISFISNAMAELCDAAGADVASWLMLLAWMTESVESSSTGLALVEDASRKTFVPSWHAPATWS